MMYDIDSEHSVKNNHERPQKGYAGTPGAATIYLQSELNPKEYVVNDNSSEEISDLSNMSRYQLIARICKLGNISDSDK